METDNNVDIFWSSAQEWERLSQHFVSEDALQGDEYEAPRLFSIDRATDRAEACRLLNDVLADSVILLGLYKKHFWLIRGQHEPELEELLTQHALELNESMDELAQCVHVLGGVAISDPRHIADVTTVPLTPNGSEESPALLYRILEVHRIVIQKIRRVTARAAESRDERTNRQLASDVLSRHERHAWFIAQQLVGTLTNAGASESHPRSTWDVAR